MPQPVDMTIGTALDRLRREERARVERTLTQYPVLSASHQSLLRRVSDRVVARAAAEEGIVMDLERGHYVRSVR
jgi:hypothetical protein